MGKECLQMNIYHINWRSFYYVTIYPLALFSGDATLDGTYNNRLIVGYMSN